MSLVVCPHCSTRVLPLMDRACPACRVNVDAPPAPKPKPEEVAEAVYYIGAEPMRAGAGAPGVARVLADRGLDRGPAASVVSRLERADREARREIGRKNMVQGAVWCFIGVAVTTMTFRMAAGGGGKVVVAWGAIVFGFIQFVRGLGQSAEG